MSKTKQTKKRIAKVYKHYRENHRFYQNTQRPKKHLKNHMNWLTCSRRVCNQRNDKLFSFSFDCLVYVLICSIFIFHSLTFSTVWFSWCLYLVLRTFSWSTPTSALKFCLFSCDFIDKVTKFWLTHLAGVKRNQSSCPKWKWKLDFGFRIWVMNNSTFVYKLNRERKTEISKSYHIALRLFRNKFVLNGSNKMWFGVPMVCLFFSVRRNIHQIFVTLWNDVLSQKMRIRFRIVKRLEITQKERKIEHSALRVKNNR